MKRLLALCVLAAVLTLSGGDPAPAQERRLVMDVVQEVCKILLNETTQVTACQAETMASGPHYQMVIHGRFSAHGAQVMCQETAREVSHLANRLNADPVLPWHVHIHTPYTGNHPLVRCRMYR